MQPKTPEAKLLAAYFNLLSDMGRAGERIWEVSKGIEDIQEKLAYLKYAVSWLRAKAKEDVWEVPPVDFRTFVESRELLDKPGVLWPKVMEAGQEMNSGKYVEAVLTGAIGVAKSTLAIYTQAYQVYVLSCMKNPHAVFDLDPSSEILIVFQSINKNLAMDVDYRRFRSMIDDAPYFQTEFTYNRGRESDMRFDRFNIVVKPVAGHDTAAIGQNVIGGILDELNFMAVVENSKQTRDGSLYDQATQNYNSIARRRESRFMQLGQLPGMLCLVSSRNYPGQFTDKKEEEARRNPRIYIYDKRLWEIRPERFSGEKFQMSTGMWTVPLYFADANTPRRNVPITSGWTEFSSLPNVPVPPNAKPDPSDDAHLTIVDRARGCVYDFWGASGSGSSLTAKLGNAMPIDSSGVDPGGLGARASGFSGAAGLVTYEDLKKGSIDHALVFAYPKTRSGGPVAPATKSDGRTGGSDAIPIGARVRLDPTLNLNSLGLNRYEMMIARALQKYGMILGDTSGGFTIYAQHPQSVPGGSYGGLLPDVTWVDLSKIPTNKFQVMKLGPQRENASRTVGNRCNGA